jgi:hypothetical protein
MLQDSRIDSSAILSHNEDGEIMTERRRDLIQGTTTIFDLAFFSLYDFCARVIDLPLIICNVTLFYVYFQFLLTVFYDPALTPIKWDTKLLKYHRFLIMITLQWDPVSLSETDTIPVFFYVYVALVSLIVICFLLYFYFFFMYHYYPGSTVYASRFLLKLAPLLESFLC